MVTNCITTGGYKIGEEDYRWVHVKKMFSYPEKKIKFHIFNFVFIAFIQNWLLLSLTLPLWFIQTHICNETRTQEKFNWFVFLDCKILFFLFNLKYI